MEMLTDTVLQDSTYPKVINPQLYFLKNASKIFVYSPLFNSAAELSEAEYDFLTGHSKLLENNVPEEYTALSNSFLYVHKEDLSVRKETYGFNGIENLNVIVTSTCNLRCKYCYIYGGESEKLVEMRNLAQTPQDMDVEVVKHAVKSLNPKNVILFGWGEPTIAFSKLKRLCDALGTEKKRVSLVTNGVFYGQRTEIVRFMVENGIKMQISFDGLPQTNDINRVTAAGRGSSEEILKTIQEIKKYGPLEKFATVRATVCGGAEGLLLKSVKYLADLGFRHMDFEPVEFIGRAVENVESTHLDIFVPNIVDAVIYGKVHGLKVTSRILPSSSGETMSNYGCKYVAGRATAIAPDGSLYSCTDPINELRVGKIIAGNRSYEQRLDYENIKSIQHDRDVSNLTECKDCPVKCGGGCTKESFNHYGDLKHGGESPEMCDAKRLALLAYIKQSFGI